MSNIPASQIEAAARALHWANAPRIGNGVEEWENISPTAQARWMKQATAALEAARAVRDSEVTPVEVRDVARACPECLERFETFGDAQGHQCRRFRRG